MNNFILLKPRRSGQYFSACIVEFYHYIWDNKISKVEEENINKFLHSRPQYENFREILNKYYIK